MTISTTSKTLEQTIAAIHALDLRPIKFKAMRREDGYGWSAAYADQLEIAYKRYLILITRHPELTIAPSHDIDRFWHTHILDTMKYAEDCEAVFGHFLHHFPYLGLRGEEDAKALEVAGETMRQLYSREFGEPMPIAAAYCSVTKPADVAYCSIAKPADATAYCSIAKPADATAYCSVAKPADATAYCSVARLAANAAKKGCSEKSLRAAQHVTE